MQFLARVGSLVLLLSQQGVSLQQREFVVGAAGNLGVARPGPLKMLKWWPSKGNASNKTYGWSGGIDFGGTHHGEMEKSKLDHILRKDGDNMRPELVRTQVCDDDFKCGECTQETACWHGSAYAASNANDRIRNRDGKLKLDVPANSSHKRFVAEVWASCASGEGRWSVHVWPNGLKNGFLKIFVDDKLHEQVKPKSGEFQSARYVNIPVEKDSRVRVEFIREETGVEAFGLITLRARGVDEYVDDCMGVKYCLAGLGDGSESAFDFRNSNVQQLGCLNAHTTDERNNISDHCEVWDTCLTKEPARKKKLRTLLKVGLGTRASLSENENQYGRRRRKWTAPAPTPAPCRDPANEDAESFDCECSAELSRSCDDDEDCFRKFFCDNSNVCDSWKGENCESSLMAKQNASALARREAGDDSIAGARLDSALDGKCSG